jgi:alpha-glucosidase
MYRAALRLRRELGLGRGSLAWLDGVPELPDDRVVAYLNGDLLVLANLGAEPVPLPVGATVLLASAELDADGRVPTDVTVWARI